MNTSPLRRRPAFTLIELLIAITVIGILATLGTFTFVGIQREGRDTERETKMTAFAESLEAYYETNGEYPGCGMITAEPATIRSNTLRNLDPSVLRSPHAADAVQNSVTCRELSHPDVANQDVFTYTGDTSEACQAGPACAKWTLSWRKETGGIGTITSRRTAEAIATTPTITITGSTLTSISLSWNPAAEAVSYDIRYSTLPSFSSNVVTRNVTTGTVLTVTGLAPSTAYYFRVKANLPSSSSSWSETTTGTTVTLTTPTGTPTISAAMSDSTARGTAGGGACQSGATLQRSLRHRVNEGSWSGWSGWSAATTLDVTSTTEGHRYTFETQARCLVGSTGSSATTSNTASVIRPVAAPSNLTISAAMSGTNAVGTAAGGSCGAGVSLQRQIRNRTNNGTWSGWETLTTKTIAATQGVRYGFQQQARCNGTNASSGWVSSTESSVVYAVSAPSGLTISAAMSGTNARGTAGGGSCATGTSIERQIRYRTNGGSWSGWTGGATRDVATAEGGRNDFQQQARCNGASASSGWASSGENGVTRPITTTPSTSVSVNVSGTNATWTWTAASCPSGTTANYEYRTTLNGTAGGSTNTNARSISTSVTSQGVLYGVQVRARCVSTNTNGSWSGWASQTHRVAVTHERLNTWIAMLRTDHRPSVKLKSFTGSCASGVTRQVRINTSSNTTDGSNNQWIVRQDWMDVTSNNTVINLSAPRLTSAGDAVEFTTRTRCLNKTTNYPSGSDGLKHANDIGNLYRSSHVANRYVISCAPVSNTPSYCYGGYNNQGTLKPGTTRNSCSIKPNGIPDTSERFSPMREFGATPQCW